MNMTHNVSITLPSTFGRNSEGDKALLASVHSTIIKTMCEHYGGCTVTAGQGYWVADDGELVIEQVTIVQSYTDRVFNQVDMRTIAQFVKDMLKQDAVLYTIDGVAYLY